jgi:hypothetical protein
MDARLAANMQLGLVAPMLVLRVRRVNLGIGQHFDLVTHSYKLYIFTLLHSIL